MSSTINVLSVTAIEPQLKNSRRQKPYRKYVTSNTSFNCHNGSKIERIGGIGEIRVDSGVSYGRFEDDAISCGDPTTFIE